MRYVRELEDRGAFKRPVEMSLLTNGALVDGRTIRAAVETETDVSVSIDGPRRLHDAARVDINKRGTFDQAMRGFRMFRDAGLNPGVSCTLNRHNINEIDEIVDFIIGELKPPGMGFNALLPTMGSGNPLDVSHELVARQLLVAFQRLREHGIYEDRIMRRVTPFKEQSFHFKDCMGVGGQIVITPEGSIGPCQAYLGMDEYFPLTVDALHERLPDIDSDDVYEQSLFEEWRYRFPLNMEACADCFAIAVCGGGCPYASEVNHGSIWEIDERICYQAKTTLEWMIWDTYDHMIADSQDS
jgi:radical SAM protein with 4Fe4S-binding SPASM domain